ncbi:hypothetical protein NO2_1089 [Candidatus Termititenax persephonae]|uniref:Uncharacterized protein n=1 Tax=Candidatus Termititenax persephonae TaxID=2218525 RepID=A0A388THE9_9BACT|nr:hypothetical protein NO2_1089 [Candidatus Termititenax persephonae]
MWYNMPRGAKMVNDFGLGNISARGREIYNKLKEQLEIKHKGEYVAIDVDSEEYFIDSDNLKAVTMAKEKFPNKIFYLAKIGSDSVFEMHSFSPFKLAV